MIMFKIGDEGIFDISYIYYIMNTHIKMSHDNEIKESPQM